MSHGGDRGGSVAAERRKVVSLPFKISKHDKEYSMVTCTGGGTVIAAISGPKKNTQGRVTLWNAVTLDPVAQCDLTTLTGEACKAYAVAVAPDGKRLACGCQKGVYIIHGVDLHDGQWDPQRVWIPSSGLQAVVFSADFKWAVGRIDKKIHILNMTSREVTDLLVPKPLGALKYFACNISSNSKCLGVASVSKQRPQRPRLYVYKHSDSGDRFQRAFTHDFQDKENSYISSISFSEKGDQMAVGFCGCGREKKNGTWMCMNIATGDPTILWERQMRSGGAMDNVDIVAISPDGTEVASASSSGEFHRIQNAGNGTAEEEVHVSEFKNIFGSDFEKIIGATFNHDDGDLAAYVRSSTGLHKVTFPNKRRTAEESVLSAASKPTSPATQQLVGCQNARSKNAGEAGGTKSDDDGDLICNAVTIKGTEGLQITEKRKQINRNPDPEYTIHQSQIVEAECLFEKIKQCVSLEKYDNFELHIRTPNFNSLYEQNVERLTKFIQYCQKEDPRFFETSSDMAEQKVSKNNSGRLDKEKIDSVFERVEKEPKTLFFVVHDEAHYEATKDGAANTFVNDLRIRSKPNVLTLSVSATPYNLLTQDSQIPNNNIHAMNQIPNNIHAMNTHPIQDSLTYAYYGLQHFSESKNLKGQSECQDKIPFGCMCEADKVFMQLVKDKQAIIEKDLGPEKRSNQVRVCSAIAALIQDYVNAMELTKIDDNSQRMFPNIPCEESMTQRMVRDLVNLPFTNHDGAGIMILIRQPLGLHNLIYRKLKEARRKCKLDQRFAVLCDLDSSDSLDTQLKNDNQDLHRWMSERNGGQQLKLYSDLKGLPCILILCQKGKMGDSFPQSLRYYDLRLKYGYHDDDTASICRAPAEQDLGRAFRWASSVENVPIIIVGQRLFRVFGGNPSGSSGKGLLERKPDDHMEKDKELEDEEVYPGTEYDTEHYRKHWKAASNHFDHGGKRRESWCNNKRRFLLFGRPQIGKTGIFLYLSWLLWKAIERRKNGEVDESDVAGETARVGPNDVGKFDWVAFYKAGEEARDRRAKLREMHDGTLCSRLEAQVKALIKEEEKKMTASDDGAAITEAVAQLRRQRTGEARAKQEEYFTNVIMRDCKDGRRVYDHPWCRERLKKLRAESRGPLERQKHTFRGIFGTDAAGRDAFIECAGEAGLAEERAGALWDAYPKRLECLLRGSDLPDDCTPMSFCRRCIAELRRGGTGLVEPAQAWDLNTGQ